MVTPQFHAFRNPYPESVEGAPYLVVLQSPNLDHRVTTVVAPLVSPEHVGAGALFRPRFDIEGRTYALNMLQVGAMPTTDIGPSIAELDRYQVIQAYDALISGAWS